MVRVELYHEENNDDYSLFSIRELNSDGRNMDDVRLLIIDHLGTDYCDFEYKISIYRSHESDLFDIIRVYFKNNISIKRSMNLDKLLEND